MTGAALFLVLAMTRAWVRVYTGHAARERAEARRTEIESDVWEMGQDPDLGSPARRARVAAVRLINGVPDDIAWAFDHLDTGQQMLVRRVLAVAAATLMVLSLWAVPSAFVNGRREVVQCAATAPRPESATDFRLEIIRCAGAFFRSPAAQPVTSR